MAFRRMCGVAGVLAVVLFVASFAADTGTYALANMLGALSALSMLVYFAGFAIPFRRSDREHGEAYGTVIVGSAVVAVTSIALAVGLFAALGNRVEELDDSALWLLRDGGNIMFAVAILTVFVGAGSAAVATMRRGIMSRWFGRLSGLVALTALTGLIPFFTDGDAVQAILAGFRSSPASWASCRGSSSAGSCSCETEPRRVADRSPAQPNRTILPRS